MANSKISAQTSATTPLAGTETLPIVQSSTTKQVSVANLTAGRNVSVSKLTVSGSGTIEQNGAAGGLYFSNIATAAGATNQRFYTTNASGATQLQFALFGGATPVNSIYGNLNIETAAKGVNFTANTPAAGMTSQLLNWYEEGTWTPNQGAGLTLVGAFSSTGRYTRIGRQVSISGTVTGATSVAITAAGVITSNLPFTVVTAGHGDATNVAINASATVICTGTSVTSAAAIAATATITFSATYFV